MNPVGFAQDAGVWLAGLFIAVLIGKSAWEVIKHDKKPKKKQQQDYYEAEAVSTDSKPKRKKVQQVEYYE